MSRAHEFSSVRKRIEFRTKRRDMYLRCFKWCFSHHWVVWHCGSAWLWPRLIHISGDLIQVVSGFSVLPFVIAFLLDECLRWDWERCFFDRLRRNGENYLFLKTPRVTPLKHRYETKFTLNEEKKNSPISDLWREVCEGVFEKKKINFFAHSTDSFTDFIASSCVRQIPGFGDCSRDRRQSWLRFVESPILLWVQM